MISSIELQIISRILTSESQTEVDALCGYDASYYNVFKDQIQFILDHRSKYGNVPDTFTFQAEFPDVELVKVTEPLKFLTAEIKKNKQHIMLLETFNKLKDLGNGDVSEAWQYIGSQHEKAQSLSDSQPMNIVKDAKIRAEQIVEFNKAQRIPTGFPEIDKLMYGGMSTVEELLLIVARTNTGKSWVVSKMMESAQKHGFPSLCYSPEMQAAFLGTRFDTWKGKFVNSDLHRGNYSQEYLDYLDKLSKDGTSAYILEDKDTPEGVVTVSTLAQLVKQHGIKLLLIDGLSYMKDELNAPRDDIKYKNLCTGLFRLSKQFGCAVVVTMQANRETKEEKDEKGVAMPTLYNIEGSDHPARICTQAFCLRQIFDRHILEIRMEKSRTAANTKPLFTYSWDPGTGDMALAPDEEGSAIDQALTKPNMPIISGNAPTINDVPFDVDDGDEEVEF